MAKVFLFPDAPAFTEFVNLNRSTRAAGKQMELLTVCGDRVPGGRVLVLAGFAPRGLASLFTSFTRVEMSREGAKVKWKGGEGRIESSRTAESLADFVALEPDPQPIADGHVYFLTTDDVSLSRLVRQSLHLGNDRIHFASIPGGTLLRVERPSFFLVQQVAEDGGAELLRAAVPGMFIRQCWRHPLEALWKSGNAAPADWIFLRPDAEPASVTPAPWRDIYELLSPVMDLPLAPLHTGQAPAPARVRVPLRLIPAAQSAEPELWLLDADGLSRMEPLLAVLDQDDVVPYQVSIRRDDTGTDLIFVREKVARGSRRHLEFSGRGFVPFLGISNLFLPAGHTLLPPLRRHVYRDLFQLEPENLTLVLPGEDGALRVLALPERSFTALTALIDYIVESGTELLLERTESSIFDLGPWAAAPSHSGLSRAQAPARQTGPSSAPEAAPASEKKPLEEEVKKLDTDAFLRQPQGIDESTLDELHRQELDLERTVIRRQSASGWQELMRVKLALAKEDDALLCAVEALWFMEHGPVPEVLRVLERIGTERFPEPGDAMGCAPQPHQSCVAAFRLTQMAPERDSPDAAAWVRAMHVFLTAHHDSLRLKERWLAWGQVLRLNGDARREVQLREEIRTLICESGLPLENTPAFIRTRLFLDRSMSADQPEEASHTAAGRAVSHLQALEETAVRCRVPAMAELWRALLGRAMARIGDLPAAGRLIAGLTRSPDAWTALFVSQTARLIDPAQAPAAESHLDRTLTGADAALISTVQDAREAWSLRAKMDNPAAFLAQENRERTYPRGGNTERGVLMELKQKLEAAQRAGDETAATSIMHQMLTLPEAKDYDDAVRLPQLIEALVAGLERYKWGLRGAGLLPLFSSFSQRAANLIKKPDPFYAVVLRANLAAGLLAADDPAGAAKQVERAIGLLGGEVAAPKQSGSHLPPLPQTQSNMGELDFVDSCAAVVRSIEQLPLESRRAALTSVAAALFDRFADRTSHFYTRPKLYSALVRCAEQIVEAAISRDRLSLELFRNYQLQDEFLILQRVQHETFTHP